MRTISILLTAYLSFAPNLRAQEAWIIQTDLADGLTYHIDVTGEGGAYNAALPVSEHGAMFELWARGTAWDSTLYHLDTKLLNVYSPVATLNIISEDPYVRGDPASGTYVRRTRADRPFSLEIHISGLVEGSTNPAEQYVYFSVEGLNYDLAKYSGDGQTPYPLGDTDMENGDLTLGPLYHELTSPTLITGCGDQTFTFVRNAADGVPATVLAKPKLEVWPVATATLSPDPDGTTQSIAGRVFIDRIPPLFLTLRHLFPDSRTYAQIYPGPSPPELGTTPTIIAGTELRFGLYYDSATEEPSNVPQNLDIPLDNLSIYAAADGIWTLEVITETPFFVRAPETLLTVTFEVDRVISTRGQLSAAERTAP